MEIQTLHELYVEQSMWFEDLRRKFYRMASIASALRVLEIGAGTCVMTPEIEERCRGLVLAADINPLALARGGPGPSSTARKIVADGSRLPLKPSSMDAVVCQMLMLWVREPALLVEETRRVLRGGGTMILCAEPDYGGALEYPASCGIAGLIARKLSGEGADPMVGRKLLSFFPKEKWEIVDFQVHPVAPQWQQADGDPVGRPASRVRREIEGIVDEDILARWETELAGAVSAGSYFGFVPHFGLLARKRH
jgi:SAM-dependent methyltransferase